MLTVGLVFHSTRSDNLGVGALTASEVAILEDVARRVKQDLRIIIFDWTGKRSPYVTGSNIEIREMTGKTLFNPFRLIPMLRGVDAVIDIGAGDSFADIYGGKRLRRMFTLKFGTHLAGRPLVVAPQTIGPFNKPLSRFLARITLRRSAIISTRDRLSTGCAQAMVPGRDIIEASDVALRLPYEPSSPSNGSKPKVGINISGLLMSGGYTRSNMFGLKVDYPAMIRTLIESFLYDPSECEVHLVPHVILETQGGLEDDVQPALDLQSEFPELKVAPAFGSPSEAKSYIAGLDFFCGARMHACIAAFSSGVPVVPMAYSRKFAGLFGTLGYNRTVDCTAETAEDIIAKVLDGYKDRAILLEEQRSALQLGLSKLGAYEEALADLFRRIRPAEQL